MGVVNTNSEVDLSMQLEDGSNALIDAIKNRHLNIVELLVKQMGWRLEQINIKDKSGMTALDYAEKIDNIQMINLLKEVGAKKGYDIINK